MNRANAGDGAAAFLKQSRGIRSSPYRIGEDHMPVKGSCHCGVTQFEVEAAPASLTRCTCSFCHKRGALWAYYTPEQFKLTTERNRAPAYKWRSFTVEHHFCPICGCGTFTESPEWVDGKPHPTRRKVAVNAWLLDDFDVDSATIEVIDGRNLW
jgi:hypothetical protein